MTIETTLSFFFIVFIFVITPGPGVFAIIGKSMNAGAISCVGLIAGMIAGDIVYLLLACFGLAVIINKFTLLFIIIKVVGAVYLLYLAYKMITAEPALLTTKKAISKKEFLTDALQGFLISISNPKVILFYIAILPLILDVSVLNAQDVVLVSIVCALALFCGAFGIAVSIAYTRKYFKSVSSMKKLNVIAGIIMGLAGIYIGLTIFMD